MERNADAAIGLERLAGPDHLVESAHATMQRVRPIVLREVVRPPVERELTIGDAIGVAAHDRAEVRRVLEITRETVEAEDDVVEVSGAVGRADRRDDAAVCDDLDFDTVRIRERELGLHRVTQEEEHGRINRVTPESCAIDRESSRERCIDL